jgi:hypothetical protein
MKRCFLFSALLCSVLSLTSCGLANSVASTAGRTVQSVVRTVGM